MFVGLSLGHWFIGRRIGEQKGRKSVRAQSGDEIQLLKLIALWVGFISLERKYPAPKVHSHSSKR